MKKITFLLFGVLLSLSILAQSTYNENFDEGTYWAGGTMTGYNAKTYTNDAANPANDLFSTNFAVRETSYVTSGSYAWRLDDNVNAYLRYECEETVNGFQVQMARWDNSPVPYVTIQYSTNSGVSYTLIENIDGSYFSGDKVYQLYSHTFGSSISPDSPGDKVYIEFLTTAGERMLYDDFQLNYGTGGPTPLDANFSADQTSAITGVPVNFVDLTSGGTLPYSYEWDLDGDGQFDDSTDPNPSFTYTTAGTYDVHLRVTDGDLTVNVESKLAYITVVAPIEVADIATLRGSLQGELYKITGEVVLTFQQSYRNQKYIQDATAAILIDDDAGMITTGYSLGDGITDIVGTLGEYGNMMQFVPAADPGAATSSGNTVSPQIITINELYTNFENYEAELVQLLDITFANGGSTFATGTAYPISDASKASGNFRTTFYDADYIGSTIPNNANIIGLPNARFDGDYITSRFAADIEEIVPVDLTPDFTADQTSVPVGGTVEFTDLTSGGTLPYSYEWDLDGDGQFDDSTDPNPSFQYNVAGIFDVSLRVTDAVPNTVTETKTGYITVVDVATGMIINEADADTPGTDTQEFIELFDDGIGNTDLSGLVVVLYNGSNDLSYAAFDLDGYSTGSTGYFVLGNAGVPNVDYIFANGTLQNGADAIALYVGNDTDFPNGTPPVTTTNLLDALVYDTGDPDDDGLLVLLNPGQPQVDERGRGNGAEHSNQRIPNGSGGQRNTDTYDQSPPTPGAENVLIFTDWTGDVDEDWDNAGNWHNGIPGTVASNATIPDVSEKAPFPVISTAGTVCNQLFIASNAELYINVNGDLTTNGLFTNSGTFTIMSDGTANVGSYIDNGGTSGGGIYHFYREMMGTSATGENHGWHYISMPTNGLTSDQLLPDYYLNLWDETADSWVHVEGGDCNNPAVYPFENGVGYSVLRDLDYTCPNPVGNNLDFGGSFYNMHNSGGTYSVTYTTDGTFEGGGWNLFGNPYTSPIDNNTMVTDVTFPTTLNAAVYIYDDNSLDYLEFSTGVGVAQVPATQGFFMQATDAGTFTFNNTWRTHAGSDNFYKDAVADVLELKVTGNGYSDNIFIRFLEEATIGYDRMYDAHKLISSAEFVPQIYTTNGVNKLAINALPATPIVSMGFTSVSSGEYTISAIETSDFTNVVLEDRFTGDQTNLFTDSYTFNYTVNDDPDRFFVHFTPLGTPELSANSIDVWSNDHKIYVQAPEINGEIVVFNMMGQEVIRAEIEPGLNVIPVTDVNAFYVVKIFGSEVAKTGKVYVK